MAKTDPEISEPLAEFIARQHVFFVASAPLAADGHVNVSPKGLDSFRVLGPRQVAYLDLTGSGVETIASARTGVSRSCSAHSKGHPRSSACTGAARCSSAARPISTR